MKYTQMECVGLMDYLVSRENELIGEIERSRDIPEDRSLVELCEGELRTVRMLKDVVKWAEKSPDYEQKWNQLVEVTSTRIDQARKQ